MSRRKVCVITGTRAEYGLFYPVMKKIEMSSSLDLQIVATTMHLCENFGLTYKQIEDDGFIIDEKIENLISSGTKTAMAKSTGLGTMMISDALSRLNPDIVLLLGDRFETLAAATSSMLLNIPIAHIHGGEITEGAVDEQIRHAITKMSYLHFASTETYAKRIIQMGEDPSKVFCTGAPGIDNIINMNLLKKDELEVSIDWKIVKMTALFTYHPETLSGENVKDMIVKILDTIRKSKLNILFTYANADESGYIINNEIEKFVIENPKKYKVIKSLGQKRYLSAMKYVDVLIGNTSSGIIEAASFGKPVVNIGDRQKGRLRNANVIDCSIERLKESIDRALDKDFIKKSSLCKNLYGNGKASVDIVQSLEKMELKIKKRFYDYD